MKVLIDTDNPRETFAAAIRNWGTPDPSGEVPFVMFPRELRAAEERTAEEARRALEAELRAAHAEQVRKEVKRLRDAERARKAKARAKDAADARERRQRAKDAEKARRAKARAKDAADARKRRQRARDAERARTAKARAKDVGTARPAKQKRSPSRTRKTAEAGCLILGAQHDLAIAMHLEGSSTEEIAYVLGVDPGIVDDWWEEPVFLARLRERETAPARVYSSLDHVGIRPG